ncbi:hypothetical protein [Endozoicomonas elysicola]|uniref:Uncharacterized protein n=1 Tax=Endozoicomonas elysicola TaxID=305900 RepID=A0A081KDH2_9GAMM|nr:hypothetical protein [Endozoicomonas elysicola]KEI72198.1 hypothetical protein GV64_17005 [Endozoicomonas elysicola]
MDSNMMSVTFIPMTADLSKEVGERLTNPEKNQKPPIKPVQLPKTEGLSSDNRPVTIEKPWYQRQTARCQSITAWDVFKYTKVVVITGSAVIGPALIKEFTGLNVDISGTTAATTSAALIYDALFLKFADRLIRACRPQKEVVDATVEEQDPLIQQIPSPKQIPNQEAPLLDDKENPEYKSLMSEPSMLRAMEKLEIEPLSDNPLQKLYMHLWKTFHDKTPIVCGSDDNTVTRTFSDNPDEEAATKKPVRSAPSITFEESTSTHELEETTSDKVPSYLLEAYNLCQLYKSLHVRKEKEAPLAEFEDVLEIVPPHDRDSSENKETVLKTTTV